MPKVQFGISNVHYAVIDPTTGKHGTPVAMPGADTMTISNSGGDNNDIYKDNVKYWSRSASTGKSGELQMAMFPEEFLINVLGQTKETGGGISEGPNDVANHFALMWEVDTDDGARRVCWFDCTATVPTRTDTTITDSVTEGMETSTITAIPFAIGGVKKTQYVCKTGDDDFATFFTKVPLIPAG